MKWRVNGIYLIVLVVLIFTAVLFSRYIQNIQPPRVGATFSVAYAEYLGLDSREVYLAVLDDLQVASLRIPVYWNRLEVQSDRFEFEELDWMMDEAKARDVDVTLAIGIKVPRWPECFLPDWVDAQNEEQIYDEVMHLLHVVVDRYKDHDALERWQVENEPFFAFGVCPQPNKDRFYDEISLVKELDPDHPVQTTTSGEQSLWAFHTNHSDVLGVSLYRAVWNKITGHFVFPFPPLTYTLQGWLASHFVEKVIISELQMEPWFETGPFSLTHEERLRRFQAKHLKRNFQYAMTTGISEVYLWGVEWWYFMKQQGEPSLWEEGRKQINELGGDYGDQEKQ